MESKEEVYETETHILSLVGSGNIRFCDDYPHKVTIDGIDYPSVRHAVLSLKTENYQIRKQIASCTLPADLKNIERSIVRLAPRWNKDFIIKSLERFTFQRFKNDPDLKQSLVSTYPKKIENGLYKGLHRFDIDEVCDETNTYGIILMGIRANLMP